MKLSRLSSQRRRHSAASAFTLIEIVLVLVIISLLAGSVIFTINRGGFFKTAQNSRINGDVNAISTALLKYYADNGRYPTTDQGLQALVTRPSTGKIPANWAQCLDEVPTDPMGNPYQYKYPNERSNKEFDLFSLGKDETESEDDIGNWKPKVVTGS